MKVVLFCGGLGMRIREHADSLPKPLVNIGYRPILWHVMKYYAHFGHKDFILCLGHQANLIKEYFLNYNECLSNDFVLSNGGKNLQLLNDDTHDWKITFADTGSNSNIGQRLKAVQKYLQEEEVFLANYSDGLTDLHLPKLIDIFHKHKKIAIFLCVKPSLTYHFVSIKNSGLVTQIGDIHHSNIRINGGFYVFRKEIFEYIKDGEELVHEPFQRLIRLRKLFAHRHNGFFASMDTFKDKQRLDDLHSHGNAPWEVWKTASAK